MFGAKTSKLLAAHLSLVSKGQYCHWCPEAQEDKLAMASPSAALSGKNTSFIATFSSFSLLVFLTFCHISDFSLSTKYTSKAKTQRSLMNSEDHHNRTYTVHELHVCSE